MALRRKQQRFVAEYLVDLNAKQAAIRAGYSVRSAKEIGYENLTKPHLIDAIAERHRAKLMDLNITADRTLKEIARIAYADPRKLMEWGPDGVTLKKSADLSDDEAASIDSASQTITQGGGSIKIKTQSKLAALRLLCEHLGLTEKPTPLEAFLALLPADVVAALRERLATPIQREIAAGPDEVRPG